MTRYPKSGINSKWTIAELKAIPPQWLGDTIHDGDGLFGEVRVSASNAVSIRFKYAFKWNGKTSWYSCGSFPANDLASIRRESVAARKLVKSAVDPRLHKQAKKIEAQLEVEATIKRAEMERSESLTFNDLFETWVLDGVHRSDDNKYILQSFNKHALPKLRSIELRVLNEHNLRDLYREIVANGKIATAVELSKDIRQMLRWAEKRKPWRSLLIDGNPSELVEIVKLLPKGYTKDRKRLLSPNEIRQLNYVFEQSAVTYAEAHNKYAVERPLKKTVQIAVWICLSTLSRIGELLRCKWEHIDFENRTWFIPAENTKGVANQKCAQIVYLSDFTLHQFRSLYEITKHSSWAFPNRGNTSHVNVKSATKLIGDRQCVFKSRTKKLSSRVESNSLVLGAEEWTPHDLRRTGATLMQKLKINRDVINLCQNHVIGTKVDRVYLLDDYAEDKKHAWHLLGLHIQEILNLPPEASVSLNLQSPTVPNPL